MNDEKKPDTSGKPGAIRSGAATPNRDHAREAPIIDARPGEVKEVKTSSTAAGASLSGTSLSGTSPGLRPAEPKASGDKPGQVAASGAAGSGAAGPKTAVPPAQTSTAPLSGAMQNSANATEKPGDSKRPAIASSDAAGAAAAPTAGGASASPATKPAGGTGAGGTGNRPSAASPAPGKSGAGTGSLIAASVGGAAIALAVAWALQASMSGNNSVTELASRVKNNETALASQTATLADLNKFVSPAALSELDKRIAALEAAVKQQSAAASSLKSEIVRMSGNLTASSPDLRPLELRIAGLETLLAQPKSEIRATQDPGAQPSATANTAAVQSLAGDLGTLEARLKLLEAKIKPPADLAPVKAQIAALERKIVPLEKQVGVAVSATIAPLAAALASTKRAIEETSTSVASNAKAIADTGEKISVSVARSNAAGAAIIARTLSERVAGGKPFGGLVAAVEAMGVNPQSVSVLKPLAEKGVASNAALLASFQALESQILQPERPRADAPVLDRLKQGALSLVKIRPAGKVSGNTPAALYSQIDTALRGSELSTALALFGKLPDKARAAGSAWEASLKSRLAADKAAQEILSNALAQLQRQKS